MRLIVVNAAYRRRAASKDAVAFGPALGAGQRE
eukprot:CAMPEP_0179314450 /NCGR_PEP_ID=MMETSP0797-20121207/54462_1 /TAXON_ID=47934 /ORGANISM="Dinophysis acuminata, Strain DAEP01" /LENGTH=32 /DNA_ID= /DNA_START= /DNA_END= /DNA_ORIENTATION=